MRLILLTPKLPGEGQILSAGLDTAEHVHRRIPTFGKSWSAMQRRGPTANPSVMLLCTAVSAVARVETSLVFQPDGVPSRSET